MTESNPRYFRKHQTRGQRELDELSRRQGITKPATLEDLLEGPEVFESDEELAEFLRTVREDRRRNHD